MTRHACQSSSQSRTTRAVVVGHEACTTSSEEAREAQIPVRLHFIDVPADRRWARIAERNETRGATFLLEVTRSMFDFVENRFEKPRADEAEDFVHWWS